MRRSPLALTFVTSLLTLPLCYCSDPAPQVAAAIPAPASSEPAPPPSPAPTSPAPASPTPTPAPTPRKLNSKRLTKTLDRYLRGRPLSISVKDLTTGSTFRYHAKSRFVTASTAKVDILMTLLLQKQKRHRTLTSTEKEYASLAIRYSDNHAADRLWERAGTAGGVASANKKFGLRTTRTVDGKCLDLYCWGITDTTTPDQIRLLEALIDDDSPLNTKNRAYVLGLMSKVIKEQAWGISAAAEKGDKVALKNGWQKRLAHGDLWAVNSMGRVQTEGHDLLISVLSDHHSNTGVGIAVVERVVELTAKEFRRTTPWIS